MSRFAPLLVLVLAASCASGAPEPIPDPDLRLLFIGNSLTSANDLPGLVARVSG